MLKKGCRQKGYQNRTAAYGTPEVVKQIFTGQIPTTYFNDLCNGRRLASRGEFYFRTPTKEREKPLWEPKHVEREKARHVIRDIQDARFVSNLNHLHNNNFILYLAVKSMYIKTNKSNTNH